MLGDTLTVTLDGSGGTAVVTSKINQDSYAAEYLNKGATYEIRVRVRHSKETPKADGIAYDRHNVEFTQYVYPTALLPHGRTRQAYVVFRNEPDDDLAACTDLGEALTFWLTDANILKIFGWES
jgi:hypothetical protein